MVQMVVSSNGPIPFTLIALLGPFGAEGSAFEPNSPIQRGSKSGRTGAGLSSAA